MGAFIVRKFIIINSIISIFIISLFILYFINTPLGVFVDRKLKQAIKDELGRTQGLITTHDLERIIKLDATGYGIKNLKGIEKLKNLEILDLTDNYVQDVSFLKDLQSLKTLILRNNEIIDLTTIKLDTLKGLP